MYNCPLFLGNERLDMIRTACYNAILLVVIAIFRPNTCSFLRTRMNNEWILGLSSILVGVSDSCLRAQQVYIKL